MLSRVALALICLLTGWVRGQTLTVAAAVSMKEAITAAGEDYKLKTGVPVEFAFGASGQLLAQIRSGAPIDVFISAAAKQMDDLEKENLIAAGSRRDVVSNTLVLIVPPGSRIRSFSSLNDDSVHHVALGEPKTVPAGAYGQQTLRSLKLFDTLEPKLVFGSNVRQVLDYIVSGNADAGLVYGTDVAEAGAKVTVIATASASSHEPIVYPGCVLKRSANAAAAEAFLTFLGSPDGQKPLLQRGFGPPPTTAPAYP